MNNGVDQAVATDVTPSKCIVLILGGSLCHVKKPQVWSHGFAVLAHFNEHVTVHFA